MKKIIFILSLLIINMVGFAQVSITGTPPSFTNSLSNSISTYQLSAVNKAQLLAEDEAEMSITKATPLRFGQDFSVQLDLNNSGTWESLPNGDRVWRLKIQSKGANSLNFIFNDFFMPQGAELYLYNENKNYIIGAFTALNNKTHDKFSTAPVKGSIVILEYYEPKTVQNQGRLALSSIIHAYRDMFKTANTHIQNLQKGFGDSGSCNIDVNCSQGSGWTDQIRSVGMILTNGNTRWCSGAMINNTAQDGKPYFLTANHCLDGNTSTWIYMFNYESPTCNGADGDLTNSISGSTLKASYNSSDVALMELSIPPPASYVIYYAGWDKSGIPATTTTCIHHPSGDVKKISLNTDVLFSSINNSDLWRVGDWENGTTEGGSSGSPLFDQNKRIVGQLFGGAASCNNNNFDDFGRFDISWTGNGTNSGRLSNWLNPQNTNQTTLNGQYFVTANFANNLKVDNIIGFADCGTAHYPQIEVENIGNNTITQLDITYQYSGYPTETIQWNGNLSVFQTLAIDLPAVTIPVGSINLNVSIAIPNVTDEDNSDNSFTKNIVVSNDNHGVTINLLTDAWPEEVSYRIVETTSGNTVFQLNGAQITGAQYENTLLVEELCLPDGCYDVIIDDSANDGLSGGFGSDAGSFEVIYNNVQQGIENGNFGSTATISFCLPNGNLPPLVATKNQIKSKIDLQIMPNPTTGLVYFETEKTPNQILVLDILGRTVKQFNTINNNQIDLTDLVKGLYLVRFEIEGQIVTKKVIVE
jgi:hypothetical protein